MRNLLTVLLSIFVTIPIFAQQAGNGYVIKGTVKGLETGAVYLTYKDDKGKTTYEEGVVTNGQFTFKGHVTTPRHCFITAGGQVPPGEFFVENSEISVAFDKATPDKLVVKGSKTNDLYASFQSTEKDVVNGFTALEAVYFKAIQTDDKKLMQKADDEKASLNARHRQYLKAFCSANAKSEVSEYLVLRALENDHNVTEMAGIFAQLDPSLTANYNGRLIAVKLQSVKDVATETN